jgi:structural maintenance of chromosome 1
LEEHARHIKAEAKNLSRLKKDLKGESTALEKAREAQAVARADVMSKEKRIKKAEKARDNKVRIRHLLAIAFSSHPLKKPNVTAIEAQIAHASRKMDKAEEAKVSVTKDMTRQEETVKRLQKDLEDVKKASAVAEGD